MSNDVTMSVSKTQAAFELFAADVVCPAQSRLFAYPKTRTGQMCIITHFWTGFR